MVSLITLAALLEPQDLKPAVRSPQSIEGTDLPKLAGLYSRAYTGGTSHTNAEKAADRINAVFEGTHGAPIPEASLLIPTADGRIIAAIITTDRALGEGKFSTAFIAELFIDPDHRQQGLAEELLKHAIQAVHEAGHRTLAVSVNIDNAAALAFYLSRGFRRLTQPAESD